MGESTMVTDNMICILRNSDDRSFLTLGDLIGELQEAERQMGSDCPVSFTLRNGLTVERDAIVRLQVWEEPDEDGVTLRCTQKEFILPIDKAVLISVPAHLAKGTRTVGTSSRLP